LEGLSPFAFSLLRPPTAPVLDAAITWSWTTARPSAMSATRRLSRHIVPATDRIATVKRPRRSRLLQCFLSSRRPSKSRPWCRAHRVTCLRSASAGTKSRFDHVPDSTVQSCDHQ